jgi:tripartite-type tricarboxylate transporter receptor subunit TctC
MEFLPDTPTMIEQGFNVANTITRGFIAAPGTPREVLEYLEAAMWEVFQDPEFQSRLREDLGFYTSWMGIDESAAFMAERVPIQTELSYRLGLID